MTTLHPTRVLYADGAYIGADWQRDAAAWARDPESVIARLEDQDPVRRRRLEGLVERLHHAAASGVTPLDDLRRLLGALYGTLGGYPRHPDTDRVALYGAEAGCPRLARAAAACALGHYRGPDGTAQHLALYLGLQGERIPVPAGQVTDEARRVGWKRIEERGLIPSPEVLAPEEPRGLDRIVVDEDLARDLAHYADGGQPSDQELAQAPVADCWYPGTYPATDLPVLRAETISGHARLGDNSHYISSPLHWVDPEHEWVRTQSRIVRLGRPHPDWRDPGRLLRTVRDLVAPEPPAPGPGM